MRPLQDERCLGGILCLQQMPALLSDLGVSRFFIQVIGLRGSAGLNPADNKQVGQGLWLKTVPKVAEKAARLGIKVYPLLESNKAIPKTYKPALSFAHLGAKSVIADSRDKPNVFIYVIDALRADHLGCYGYNRETSPVIDGFASEATLFEQAWAASNWTRPAVSSILTGLYPSSHGVLRRTSTMEPWPVLLPEALSSAGYATCHILTNAHLSKEWGLTQGVESYYLESLASSAWVNRKLEDYLSHRKSKSPIFVYIHTLTPHIPYAPEKEIFKRFDRGFKGSCDGSVESVKKLHMHDPKLSQDDVAHLIDLYDAEIYTNDLDFADFLSILKRYGLYQNSIIILSADHGESFNEHTIINHGTSLLQEQLRVPLIVRFPQGRFAGQRVKQNVSHIDFYPTVLAQAGIRPSLEYPLPGTDLLTYASAPDTPPSRRVYAETWIDEGPNLAAVRDEDNYKRVVALYEGQDALQTRNTVGLWDLTRDANEQKNLLTALPVRAAYGEQLIAQWLSEQEQLRNKFTRKPAKNLKLTEKIRKELKDLGYLK